MPVLGVASVVQFVGVHIYSQMSRKTDSAQHIPVMLVLHNVYLFTRASLRTVNINYNTESNGDLNPHSIVVNP